MLQAAPKLLVLIVGIIIVVIAIFHVELLGWRGTTLDQA